GVPTVLFGALAFQISFPQDAAAWAALAVSLTLSVPISFAWRPLINLAAFWPRAARAVGNVATARLSLRSGFLIPIAFLPEPWRSVAQALPFAGIVAVPIDIWLGQLNGLAAVSALAWQAAWAVALLAAGRVVLALALRRVEIHGG